MKGILNVNESKTADATPHDALRRQIPGNRKAHARPTEETRPGTQ